MNVFDFAMLWHNPGTVRLYTINYALDPKYLI